MPNGNPDFDFLDCERFFAPLAASIQRFAARRNLMVVKYDHESPSWDLCFAHPTGGFSRLELTKAPGDELQLSAVLWIDDYDRFTRHVRKMPAHAVRKDESSLWAELDAAIDEVLSWSLDQRFTTYDGYEGEWGSMSKQQFLASEPAYPVPVRAPGG